jgi:threonine synthase
MQACGARVAVLEDRDRHLAWLVRERGFYPSTGMVPAPVGSPYGIEGYKTIAFEVFFQLGGRFPGRVLIPTAGGDALYGPWKGFRELLDLGATGPAPRMIAVQAAGCDPVVQAWRRGASEVPVHPRPRTRALSIADATGGAISLVAIRESGGAAEAVTDHEIVATMRRLARVGHVVEPAAAAPVAAALAQQARGELGEDEDVVCVLTGAGVKWPAALLEAMSPGELRDPAPEAVRAWIRSFDDGERPR